MLVGVFFGFAFAIAINESRLKRVMRGIIRELKKESKK